jgi:hypothetical protein
VLQIKDFKSLDSWGKDVLWSSTNGGVENSLARYLDDRVVGSGIGIGILSELEVSITDFQVLRTTILKSYTVPIAFSVKPPLIGEQRVTNAFNFSLVHRAACSLFMDGREASNFTDSICAAHSLEIRAGSIDVLLYIAQSSGGVNDALRTSALPIVDLLRIKESAEQAKPDLKKDGIKEAIVGAAFACSIKIEGFMVTCVPGGATRLTESPIVKISLAKLSGGLAMTPVSADWKLFPRTGNEPASNITDVKVKHLFAGGWLRVDISGYYNNRRLVEWEPFLEPWRLEMLFGADLSRASDVGPLLEDKPWHAPPEVRLQPQRPHPLDFGGSRLRDIGRLLRSPFQTDNNSGKVNVTDSPKTLQSDTDFCYLMLISMSSETLSRATYPRGPLVRSISSSLLPHDRPVPWLSQFGYPAEPDINSKDLMHHPAITFRLGDSAALNLNLTGALLENLADYLGIDESGGARRLAPHWIRNDSGLVSAWQIQVVPTPRIDLTKICPFRHCGFKKYLTRSSLCEASQRQPSRWLQTLKSNYL